MSDLRRLIARMDQLNEIGNPIDNRNLPPLEGGGPASSGGTVTSGPSPFGPSVKSGPFGTTIYTSPPPRVTPAGSTPNLPANFELPAFQRAANKSTTTTPTTTTTTVAKPKVTVKPGETMDQALQRSKTETEFGNFLKGQSGQKFGTSTAGAGRGDPAVWKNPRTGKVSTSPPPADVEPPQPLNGKSFKDASAEVNKNTAPKVNRDEWGRDVDEFGRPTRNLNGDPIQYDSKGPQTTPQKERDPDSPATLQDIQDMMSKQSNAADEIADKPGILKSIGKAMWNNPKTTAALGAAAEYEREKSANWKGAKQADREFTYPSDDFISYPTQVQDFGIKPTLEPKNSATTTKESLQNKLFKEFKTFVEKR